MSINPLRIRELEYTFPNPLRTLELEYYASPPYHISREGSEYYLCFVLYLHALLLLHFPTHLRVGVYYQ